MYDNNVDENIDENNQVTVVGRLTSGFAFRYEVFGENFYLGNISVERLSNFSDNIPVMISEKLLNMSEDYSMENMQITGQFRSHKIQGEEKNRLMLFLFAKRINYPVDAFKKTENNQILLNGYICKKPIYRLTPFGREIADMMLLVYRRYDKFDRIPCICWGRIARFASSLDEGTHVQIKGRVQSRDYEKRLDEHLSERRTAYEVSVCSLESIQ